MASQFDVHVVNLPVGAFNGATEVPLIQIPASGGGVTVLQAHLIGADGTAIGGKVVTLSNAGTPALNGTVGAFAGTVVTAFATPAALTVSSAFVAAGYWLGYDQTSGTVPAGSYISLAYVMGK